MDNLAAEQRMEDRAEAIKLLFQFISEFWNGNTRVRPADILAIHTGVKGEVMSHCMALLQQQFNPTEMSVQMLLFGIWLGRRKL